jgi:DHA3 family multidrug efflux protein-like MFS transporter
MDKMKTFYAVLANTLAASLTNMFVWFAVTFWVYLQSKSVIATSVMAGVYLTIVALSGLFLGSLVDRYKKKSVMILSSLGSLVLYLLAGLIFITTPMPAFTNPADARLWSSNLPVS